MEEGKNEYPLSLSALTDTKQPACLVSRLEIRHHPLDFITHASSWLQVSMPTNSLKVIFPSSSSECLNRLVCTLSPSQLFATVELTFEALQGLEMGIQMKRRITLQPRIRKKGRGFRTWMLLQHSWFFKKLYKATEKGGFQWLWATVAKDREQFFFF